jgi:FAD binding domain.
MDYIDWMGKKLSVIYDVDCCIAGGGTAGAAAAISALEKGMNTLIVERNTYLGGSQTGGLVIPMMSIGVDNYVTHVDDMIQKRLIAEGIDVDDKCGNKGWFSSEKLKFVLEKMVTERNGNILYLADIIDAYIEEGTIKYLVVNTIDGLCAIKSKTFVDCTGDAFLSRLCGVRVTSGHPESGKNQSMSLRFEMGGINLEKFAYYTYSIGDKYCPLKLPFFEAAIGSGNAFEAVFKKAEEDGKLRKEDIKYIQFFTIPGEKGAMSFNCPEVPDSNCATDPKAASRAIIVGREMIDRLSRFFISDIPGFEDAYVIQSASMLGVRESYRIDGVYCSRLDDYNNRVKFQDGVVKVGYPVDIHGVETNDEVIRIKRGEYYEVPYRTMITKKIGNLAVAGRCISASFIMQSSIRIQHVCRALGEAAGIACYLSVKNGMPLNSINGVEVRKLMESGDGSLSF